ncbi:MAG: hypothetical protein AAF388_01115 [Bacteroidota bacterium]
MTRSKNMTKQWAWLTMLFLGIICLGITSCDDDMPDVNPPEDEAASAWLTGFRVESPQGRLYYMQVNENIPDETNIANAVELGLGARILSFGEHPYTWNDNAGTLTKWNVDRTTLELSVEGILSFASVGVTGNVGLETTFVSETKAYIPNITEGVIVEFNPSTMEITEVINFDFPFPINSNGFYANMPEYIPETEKFIYAIFYFPNVCCEYDGPDAFTILVFDTKTNTIEVKKDQRLLFAEDLLPSDDGYIYVSPGLGQPIAEKYMNNVPAGPSSEFNALRIDQDGNFDPSYSLDISEVLSTEFARAFEIAPSNNVRPFIVPNNSFAENWEDRFSIFNDFSEWNVVGVNYATGDVESLTAFDGFNYVTLPTVIDGEDYVVVGTVELTQDQVEQEVSYFARVGEGFNLTLLTRNPGGTLQIASKLW